MNANSTTAAFADRVRRLLARPPRPWGRPVWSRLRRRLRGLRLPPAVRHKAAAHLLNARAYWAAGEVGAARYELRLLAGSVGRPALWSAAAGRRFGWRAGSFDGPDPSSKAASSRRTP